MRKTMELKAYAKLNLSLDVLGRIEGGYHAMRMVMQSASLCDDVFLELTEDGAVTLQTNFGFLPSDGRNIAVKAARVDLLEVRLGRGLGGKSFVLLTGEVAAVQAAVGALLLPEQTPERFLNLRMRSPETFYALHELLWACLSLLPCLLALALLSLVFRRYLMAEDLEADDEAWEEAEDKAE